MGLRLRLWWLLFLLFLHHLLASSYPSKTLHFAANKRNEPLVARRVMNDGSTKSRGDFASVNRRGGGGGGHAAGGHAGGSGHGGGHGGSSSDSGSGNEGNAGQGTALIPLYAAGTHHPAARGGHNDSNLNSVPLHLLASTILALVFFLCFS